MSGKEKKNTKTTISREVKVYEPIRLNKYIANSGVCSRREADELIANGLIKVNGETIKEMGFKVAGDDVVEYEGRKLSSEKKVYLLLNKPKGYVTSMDDPHADRLVIDIVKNACKERIYPVGRLDKDTTGLLLFTNDGDLAKKLTHPSHKKKKLYHAFLDKPVSKAHIEQLVKGIKLEGFTAIADAASYASEDRTEVGLEIHTGENRVVRRMFEALGYKMKKLDRVMFAGLTKKNLPRGKYRFLTPSEISILKRSR